MARHGAALADYDEAVAAQAAGLLRAAGVSVGDREVRAAAKAAGAQVVRGFDAYAEAWRESRIARQEKRPSSPHTPCAEMASRPPAASGHLVGPAPFRTRSVRTTISANPRRAPLLRPGIRNADPISAATLVRCLPCPAAEPKLPDVAATDWPWWRGPRRDGKSRDRGRRRSGVPTENVVWKATCPAAATPARSSGATASS